MEKLKRVFKSRIKKNFPLSQLGILSQGKISYFLEIKTKDELVLFFKNKPENLPVFIIGNGSNTVASDAEIRGIILKLKGDFEKIFIEGDKVIVGAGIELKKLIEDLKEMGLSGLEFLYQVPGTLGGAIKMNAGCFGEEIMKYVSYIEVFKNGKISKRRKLKFSYRKGPLTTNEILLFAELRLKRRDKSYIENKIKEFVRKRSIRNLYHRNSKGSVFLNPKNMKAWKIVEELNLKGLKVGKVKVWEKNPNFFIWNNGARGEDFFKLYNIVRERVKKEKGIELKPEINFIGL